MAKRIFRGKWSKKNNRWKYDPAKGEGRRYRFGDYFGMGMTKIDISKYERLHDLEKKSRKAGLTVKEKKRFNELSNWEEKETAKALKRGLM